jgi:hypothetical protein
MRVDDYGNCNEATGKASYCGEEGPSREKGDFDGRHRHG